MAIINENETSTDAAAGIETTHTITGGDTFHGTLNDLNDVDYIKLDLERGVEYEIHLMFHDLFREQFNLLGDLYVAGELSVLDHNGNPLQILGLSSSPDVPSVTVSVDALSPGGYADTIQTDRLPDVEHLTGSAHDDILAGDRRDNEVRGQAGNDTLYGGPGGGDDVLLGGEGNDKLYGGQGDDTVSGDAGNDSLYGGPGADTFVFAPGNGNDVVMDFGRDADRVDLTAFDLNNIDDLTMTTDSEGTTIDLGPYGGGTILLADVSDIPQAEDFLI